MFEALCHTIDIRNPTGHDNIILEEFVKKHGGGRVSLATVSVWTWAMLGCERSELSALYFFDYCKSGGGVMQMRSDQKNGGQYLRIKTGKTAASFGERHLLIFQSGTISRSPSPNVDQIARARSDSHTG